MNYSTADTAFPFCPKPNHIKPCWCRGLARCVVKTAAGLRCRRQVRGSAIACYQHVS